MDDPAFFRLPKLACNNGLSIRWYPHYTFFSYNNRTPFAIQRFDFLKLLQRDGLNILDKASVSRLPKLVCESGLSIRWYPHYTFFSFSYNNRTPFAIQSLAFLELVSRDGLNILDKASVSRLPKLVCESGLSIRWYLCNAFLIFI